MPLVFAGWLFSIPVIVHEQTLVSGLANKISSLFADKIAVSFAGFAKGEKVILTGNPLRQEIINERKGVNATHPKGVQEGAQILITGGNQGSHVINLAVGECLEKLLKIARVVHVTWDNKYHDFERLKKYRGEKYRVEKWISEDWNKLLGRADLVVTRAGINTLSELAYLGKPALVIPVPYLYQDEQNKNARFFKGLGLVEILPQSRLSGESLFSEIKSMLSHLPSLREKAKAAKQVIIPDAAKRLALETYLLCKKT